MRPTAQIKKTLNETKPVAIIIFACNFWEEIAETLIKEVTGKWNNTFLILPFPQIKCISSGSSSHFHSIQLHTKVRKGKMVELTFQSHSLLLLLSSSSTAINTTMDPLNITC